MKNATAALPNRVAPAPTAPKPKPSSIAPKTTTTTPSTTWYPQIRPGTTYVLNAANTSSTDDDIICLGHTIPPPARRAPPRLVPQGRAPLGPQIQPYSPTPPLRPVPVPPPARAPPRPQPKPAAAEAAKAPVAPPQPSAPAPQRQGYHITYHYPTAPPSRPAPAPARTSPAAAPGARQRQQPFDLQARDPLLIAQEKNDLLRSHLSLLASENATLQLKVQTLEKELEKGADGVLSLVRSLEKESRETARLVELNVLLRCKIDELESANAMRELVGGVVQMGVLGDGGGEGVRGGGDRESMMDPIVRTS